MTTNTTTKYPNITAVVGDGNAFAIIGAVTRALGNAGVSKAERDQFTAEATSGDYGHLLSIATRWVNIELESQDDDDEDFWDDDDIYDDDDEDEDY